MSDQLPNLPLGLEYVFENRVQLCIECGGVTAETEPLVRRSKYRNRAFENDFMGRNGVCLNCTQTILARIVARFYETAENAVKTYNELADADDGSKEAGMKLDAYEQSIESIQLFMQRLGDYVGDASEHEVEYAHEPECREDDPSDEDAVGEDPDSQ